MSLHYLEERNLYSKHIQVVKKGNELHLILILKSEAMLA